MTVLLSVFRRPRVRAVVRKACFSSTPEQDAGVQRGMQRWVNEFVIDHTICPFAAKSTYEFHIYNGDTVTQDALNFFRKHVLETGDKELSVGDPRYSSFLVFPYISEFLQQEVDVDQPHNRGDIRFMGFYQEALELCENYAGAPSMTFTDQKVTVMPFHPDFPEQQFKMQQQDPSHFGDDGRSEARLHTTCAPFPTFHILRDSDLNDVRGKLDARVGSLSVYSILKRNDATTESLGLPKLQEMMKDYSGELGR